MGISKINHCKILTALDTPALAVKSTIPAHEQHINTLLAVKKVFVCPLTSSEPVPKKGLSVEVLGIKTDQHLCDQN